MGLEIVVESILFGRHSELALDPPTLQPDEYEEIASRIDERSRRPTFGDPRGIARALGYRVRPGQVPMCTGANCTDLILYRHDPDSRMLGLRVLHALAHCELIRAYPQATEVDAWRLTVELALGTELAFTLSLEEASLAQKHAPIWLIGLQMRVVRAAGWVA